MKTSSAPPPVSRTRARNCLLVNQLATPGLGSLMGRRIVAGIVQLALAVIGFGCVTGWFVQLSTDMYREFSELPAEPHSIAHLGSIGFTLFAVSWLLSWITSLSLLREARRNGPEAVAAPGVPPKIH